jgi:hypothetical protein
MGEKYTRLLLRERKSLAKSSYFYPVNLELTRCRRRCCYCYCCGDRIANKWACLILKNAIVYRDCGKYVENRMKR